MGFCREIANTESNAVPGLTTRQLAKVADRIMVGYEESRDNYSAKERISAASRRDRRRFFKVCQLCLIPAGLRLRRPGHPHGGARVQRCAPTSAIWISRAVPP